MERRTIVGLLLIVAVFLITPRLFPTARNAAVPPKGAKVTDSATVSQPAATPATALPPAAAVTIDTAAPASVPAATATLVELKDALSTSVFSTAGAQLERVDLHGYKALDKTERNVALTSGTTPLLSYRLLTGADTTVLSRYVLTASTQGKVTTFEGPAGSNQVRIAYTIVPDSFVTRVAGTVSTSSGSAASGYVLVDLPQTFRSFEADTAADQTAFAYAVKPGERSAEGVPFGSLDPGERKVIAGPVSWAVAKSKYFMLGVLPDSGSTQFAEAQMVGGARTSRTATRAQGTLVARLSPQGTFSFDLYTGPQQYNRLRALGRDFENSNPYGGWMQGVVQPFATIVMKTLLWMKSTLGWGYGWLLVLFGVIIRLAMWPLNQGAMRTTIKMQRIQPELNAIQQKYKGDPQKLQTEMMRVYGEHNMSPFSAFAGCLPLFLPMPILFALFFVFQNTIEFRGVPFLWLADISLKDPFYIVPLLMGASMFVLSWIGLRNSPPNPQAKMMAYVMPVMMTVLFANWASGLNLYYAVQNVAALPQQWLISNERAKAGKK